MNIKQGYFQIYKDLAEFLQANLYEKINKKRNIIIDNKEVVNKNKMILEKGNYIEEETKYKTFQDITERENLTFDSKKSIINFTYRKNDIYNIIKESESFVNDFRLMANDKSSTYY